MWDLKGVKMKPILFNAEMVRAIVDGRKVQTRRPIDWDISNNMSGDAASGYFVQTDDGLIDALKLYRYQKGDILYARETWKIKWLDGNKLEMAITYEADETWEYIEFSSDRFSKFKKYYNKKGWQPSIFMPKEAAILFLKVTDVRVEKLQDITLMDIREEGLQCPKEYASDELEYNFRQWFPDQYKEIWDSIYKSKGYGWDTNCWVWVIEFERCEKPNDGQI